MRVYHEVMVLKVVSLTLLLGVSIAAAQDGLPTRVPPANGALTVRVRPFAVLPAIDGVPARAMHLVDEPGTRRLFVNDMRGPIYTVDYGGRTVRPYLDVNAPAWGVMVQYGGRERGVQSFTLHPQFGRAGTPGYGKLYTFTDTSNTKPTPDFRPGGGSRSHDTVLLEWTAKTPTAEVYDGGPPRELMRIEQPFPNHNGGLVAFNSTAAPGTPDFGLLYVSNADGGSAGDPLNLSQNLASIFGKVLRIDPLGTSSANGKYGIPPSNPFVADKNPATLGEIYAYGVRNGQRFVWDSKNGNLLLADIGQNSIEEISLVPAGANLGWNIWEGSYRFDRTLSAVNARSDPRVTYPFVEIGHADPLLQSRSALTIGTVYRQTEIKALTNLLVFGEIVSGEIFYVNADTLPDGGSAAVRRVLLSEGGVGKTLLELIREENVRQGQPPATRADLRFGVGPNGQIFLLNKGDGTIRVMVPQAP
jgi:Glucose / Sorbosone dehydrogenase